MQAPHQPTDPAIEALKSRAVKLAAADPADPGPDHDSRFTFGLMAEVIGVLEKHGYRKGGDGAVGRSLGTLLRLTADFEGREL